MLPQTIWFRVSGGVQSQRSGQFHRLQNSTSTADAIVLKGGNLVKSISVIRDQDVDESVVVDIQKIHLMGSVSS